jgi:hypothetical protein
MIPLERLNIPKLTCKRHANQPLASLRSRRLVRTGEERPFDQHIPACLLLQRNFRQIAYTYLILLWSKCFVQKAM